MIFYHKSVPFSFILTWNNSIHLCWVSMFSSLKSECCCSLWSCIAGISCEVAIPPKSSFAPVGPWWCNIRRLCKWPWVFWVSCFRRLLPLHKSIFQSWRNGHTRSRKPILAFGVAVEAEIVTACHAPWRKGGQKLEFVSVPMTKELVEQWPRSLWRPSVFLMDLLKDGNPGECLRGSEWEFGNRDEEGLRQQSGDLGSRASCSDWRVSGALGLELLGMVSTAELWLSSDRGRACRFAFCPWLVQLGENAFCHSQLSSVRGTERSLGDILFWNSFTDYKWRLENCITLRKLSTLVGALPEFWMPFELFSYWIFPSDLYF